MNKEMLLTEINSIKNGITDLEDNDNQKTIVGINRFGFETTIFVGKVYIVVVETSIFSTLDDEYIRGVIDELEEYTIKTKFKGIIKKVIKREENRIKELEKTLSNTL